MNMLSWRPVLAILLLLSLLAGGLLSRPAPRADVTRHVLADGATLVLASASRPGTTRIVLLLPAGQLLPDDRLLALAEAHDARLAQLPAGTGDCALDRRRLAEAEHLLQGPPTLVAGSGPGAAQAWRWLAGQGGTQARALSVDFALNQPDCAQALPERAAQGRWQVAWNAAPDAPTALFARRQANADTLIAPVGTPVSELLVAQVNRLLQGSAADLPLIELPGAPGAKTLALFYSGDGGWRDLDRDIAEEMAREGRPVVGIDALRYFWQHKSPEEGARDLAALMQHYREQWGVERFVLIGYSFGADVLPAFYNRLPAAEQRHVDAMLLLALARSGSFEIKVQGWLGQTGTEAATGPELARVPADKVFCVYGADERDTSGCTQPEALGERLETPGGHHFDGDYMALGHRLMRAIDERQKP